MSTYEFEQRGGTQRISGILKVKGGTGAPGDVPTQQANGDLLQAPGGGSMPLQVIRQTVLYSDFVDSVINPGSYRFAPIHDFVAGDALIFFGVVTTEDFNDSNAGSLVFQVTDDGNAKNYSPWGGGGVANPDTGNVSGIPLDASDDTSYWNPASNQVSPEAGLFTGPVSIGICDNGSLAGDGTTGSIAVRALYIPAP